MQPLSNAARSIRSVPLPKAANASIRDSLKILESVVRELAERIEILEARELLVRTK